MNFTVKATIAGHGLHKGKPKTELEVPAMKMQHPLILYNMDPEDQQQLPLGQEMVIVLEADKAKEARDGKEMDHSKPWNWFWSFLRVATPEDGEPVDPVVMQAPGQAPAQQQRQAPAAATRREHYGGGDHREVSIMAQVALKAAVESMECLGTDNDDEVIETAGKYHRWLMKASGYRVQEDQQPDATPAPQQPPDGLPDDDPWESVRGQGDQPPLDTYDDGPPPGVVDHYGDVPPPSTEELEGEAHKFDQRDGKIPLTSDGYTPTHGVIITREARRGDRVRVKTQGGKSWPGAIHSLVREVKWRGVRKWIYTYDRVED